MYTKDAINYFSPSSTDGRGGRAAITKALNLSSGAVSQWGDLVPPLQAQRLQEITNGELKFELSLYTKAKEQH